MTLFLRFSSFDAYMLNDLIKLKLKRRRKEWKRPKLWLKWLTLHWYSVVCNSVNSHKMNAIRWHTQLMHWTIQFYYVNSICYSSKIWKIVQRWRKTHLLGVIKMSQSNEQNNEIAELLSWNVSMCVCVSVCERERETETERLRNKKFSNLYTK